MPRHEVNLFNVNPVDEAGGLLGIALARGKPLPRLAFAPVFYAPGMVKALECMPMDVGRTLAETGALGDDPSFAITLHIIGLSVAQPQTVAGFVTDVYRLGHKLGIIYADDDTLALWRRAIGRFAGDEGDHIVLTASLGDLEERASDDIARQLFADYREIVRTHQPTPLAKALLVAAAAGEAPLKFASYAISFRGGHAHVRIERETYKDLKAFFIANALRSREKLEELFRELPFEPWAPVRRQVFSIFNHVNERRKIAQYQPLPYSCLRLRRRIYQPFERQSLEAKDRAA